MSTNFPMLCGDSLPKGSGGAWIVRRVACGWVWLVSDDLRHKLRLPVDRFNWYWRQFRAAKQAMGDAT